MRKKLLLPLVILIPIFILLLIFYFMYPKKTPTEKELRAEMKRGNYGYVLKVSKELCPKGKDYACLMLSEIYEKGLGTKKDLASAKKYYQMYLDLVEKKCENGDRKSCKFLLKTYTDGNALVKRDLNKRIKYLHILCEKFNSVASCRELSKAYENGIGTDKNLTLARKYYRTYLSLLEESCEGGNKEGCKILLETYSKGHKFAKKDLSKRAKILKILCEQFNDSKSCITLGDMYRVGFGVFKDHKKTFLYHKKACELKDWEGCNALAIDYRDGIGVLKDTNKAIEYYKIACENGFADACNDLAIVSPNLSEEEKIKYLIKACKMGSGLGCSNLASRSYIYSQSLIYTNPKEAINLLKVAENSLEKSYENYKKNCDKYENSDSCYNLATYYEKGIIVKKNNKKKEKYLKTACDMFDGRACYDYAHIEEARNNIRSAIEKYKMACHWGIDAACPKLASLSSNLLKAIKISGDTPNCDVNSAKKFIYEAEQFINLTNFDAKNLEKVVYYLERAHKSCPANKNLSAIYHYFNSLNFISQNKEKEAVKEIASARRLITDVNPELKNLLKPQVKKVEEIVNLDKCNDISLEEMDLDEIKETLLVCADKKYPSQMIGKVYFATNKYVLDKKEEGNLKKAVEILNYIAEKRKGAIKSIKVVGFTDTRGSAEYNKKLSEKRAETVANFIASNLKDTELKNKIYHEGKGEYLPVCSGGSSAVNVNGEYKCLNGEELLDASRRVEIYLDWN